MLKSFFIPFILISGGLGFSPSVVEAKNTYLILNMENKAILPRNFRMTTEESTHLPKHPPSFVGFKELNISGSSQFSAKGLKKIYETIPNWNVTIVDLRQEPHGVLNGMAITWFSEKNWTNQGLSPEEIESDQEVRFEHLRNTPLVFVYKDKKIPFPVFVRSVHSEKEIVENLGMNYIRFPTTDHMRPTDDVVDRFVSYYKDLEPGTWLHFHCSAGRGRTTTFMVMFDILKNKAQVPLKDTVQRHVLLGGLDILSEHIDIPWKKPFKLERAKFIKNFYRYVKENPDLSPSWLEWIQNQQPSEK